MSVSYRVVNCPHCSQAMRLAAGETGQNVLCPHCGRMLAVIGNPHVSDSGSATAVRRNGPPTRPAPPREDFATIAPPGIAPSSGSHATAGPNSAPASASGDRGPHRQVRAVGAFETESLPDASKRVKRNRRRLSPRYGAMPAQRPIVRQREMRSRSQRRSRRNFWMWLAGALILITVATILRYLTH